MSCLDSFVIGIWEQVLPVLETSQIYHVVLDSTVELLLSARLTGQWHQTQVRDGFQCQQCRTCLYSGFVRAVRGDANNALARVGALPLPEFWFCQEIGRNGRLMALGLLCFAKFLLSIWFGLFCQIKKLERDHVMMSWFCTNWSKFSLPKCLLGTTDSLLSVLLIGLEV